MRLAAALLIVLFIGLPSLISTAQASGVTRQAVVIVGQNCSGTVIAPDLILTASHCTGGPGQTARVRMRPSPSYLGTYDGRTGTVVWDSDYLTPRFEGRRNAGLDLVLLRLDAPWPHVAQIAPLHRVPLAEADGLNISYAAGIHFWTIRVRVLGIFAMDELGDVLMYRGEALPGASGSCVFVADECVGLITHGTNYLHPPLFLGAHAGRIQAAIEDYQRRGAMVACTGSDGQQNICREREQATPPGR